MVYDDETIAGRRGRLATTKYCCVPQCTNQRLYIHGANTTSQRNLSFHRFPQIKESWPGEVKESVLRRKKKWVSALKMEKEVSNNMVVCSDHFKKSDYIMSGIQIKRPTLKKIAIPSMNLPDTSVTSNVAALKTIPVRSKKTILMSCCVKNCESKFTKESNIIYHRFPLNDKDLTRKWIECIGLENFVPSENPVLCSEHFTLDNYKNGIVRIDHLEYDAVPTVFDLPAKAKQKNRAKKQDAFRAKKISYIQNLTEETFESESNTELSVGGSRISNTGENSSNASILLGNELQIYNIESASDSEEEIDYFFNIDSMNSEEIKEKLDHMTTHYKRTQAKLKLSQKRCSLYKKEINALRQVISSLQQINSVMDDS